MFPPSKQCPEKTLFSLQPHDPQSVMMMIEKLAGGIVRVMIQHSRLAIEQNSR
jgi:hypothetical protein